MHCAFPKEFFLERLEGLEAMRALSHKIQRHNMMWGSRIRQTLYPDPFPPCLLKQVDCRDCFWVEYRDEIRYCYDRPEDCKNKDCRFYVEDYPTRCILRVIKPEGMTITEIAEVLGISKQRVEQLEKNALRKIALALKLLREQQEKQLQQSLWQFI